MLHSALAHSPRAPRNALLLHSLLGNTPCLLCGAMPALQLLVLTQAHCAIPVQVNKLDGLQHMHIPSGQTYKSPGMAYVEGDASSGEHNSLFLLLHTLVSRLLPRAAGHATARPRPVERLLDQLRFWLPTSLPLPGRQHVAGDRATIAPQSPPVQLPACKPIVTCPSPMPFINPLSTCPPCIPSAASYFLAGAPNPISACPSSIQFPRAHHRLCHASPAQPRTSWPAPP